jgi:DNA modification methylase
MKQLEMLDLLPADLRFDVIEDITAKVNLQSALARKQLRVKKILEQQTRQGERTDLISEPTCTPEDVQVSHRRESCTEKVAALFGEGAGAVRRRITVYEHAQAVPVKYGRYLEQMDKDNSPYAAFADLKTALQTEIFDKEIVPQKISSRIANGDLWTLGQHRLLCGDATNQSDVGRLLDGTAPHLMVTDPPYGVDYEPWWRKRIGNSNPSKMGAVCNDNRHDWSEAWALFNGNAGYVWFADIHADDVQASLKKNNLIVRRQIVWVKKWPVITRGHYSPQAEFCFYVVRKGKTAHWQGPKSQSNVWMIDNREDRGHGHSTQKPIECMLRPIKHNSKAGDVVYDPFVGSGTTIIAAEDSHRRCYAMDIDPQYCASAIERWQNYTGQQAALATTGRSYADVMRDRSLLDEVVELTTTAAVGSANDASR